MMKRTLLILAAFLLGSVYALPAIGADPAVITMQMPKQVLADTIQKSLPFLLSRPSESLGGSISINRIDDLVFGDQAVSGKLSLVGEDVQVNTAIGGHQIALKVGNVKVDFSTTAGFRFDQASQTLFVTPTITEIGNASEQKDSELGQLIASVFHGKEFPIVIDQLQPIISNTGNKQVIIKMSVRDIVFQPDGVHLELVPDVSASPLPQ